MDKVESLFTEHYTNNDRKKAMKFLRPLHHKDSHVVTFFVGAFFNLNFEYIYIYIDFGGLQIFNFLIFTIVVAGLFTGSFVTLFCVYAILAHITGMLQSATQAAYMESVYPIFR